MLQFPEASDRNQEWCMPKEKVLKRNSTTSSVPLKLNGLPSLNCWEVPHMFAQVLDLVEDCVSC